jgi:hypothetical protein
MGPGECQCDLRVVAKVEIIYTHQGIFFQLTLPATTPLCLFQYMLQSGAGQEPKRSTICLVVLHKPLAILSI